MITVESRRVELALSVLERVSHRPHSPDLLRGAAVDLALLVLNPYVRDDDIRAFRTAYRREGFYASAPNDFYSQAEMTRLYNGFERKARRVVDQRNIDIYREATRIAAVCNLYTLKVRRLEIAERFNAQDRAYYDLEKDYVSPGREGLTIIRDGGRRYLEKMRWGWPPPKGARQPVVNVRNYDSPFWRSALASPFKRCLVPVTQFQEWSAEPDPATGKKRPHLFVVPSRPVFAFAGVWRLSEAGKVYAFLTTGYDDDPSSHLVGAVHPKAIPVILHDEDYDRWLTAPVEDALKLAVAFPSQLMAIED